MRLKAKITRPAFLTFLQNQASPGLIFIYQLVALVSFAIIPIFASRWLKQPFIGAFVEHTLIVNTVTPTQPGTWELQNSNLPFGYQLVSLDGVLLASIHHLNQELAAHRIGDEVSLTLQSPTGELIQRQIKLTDFPAADRLSYFYIPYFIGLIYLGSSIWLFSLRRSDPAGRAFALFTVSVAMAIAALFDLYTTNYFTPLWTASLCLIGGAFINLTLLFPEEMHFVNRFPYLRWIGYIPSAALIIYALPTLYNTGSPAAYALAWRMGYIYAGTAAMIFLVWTVYRRYVSDSPISREQARLIILGAGLSFSPLALWLLLTSFSPELRFTSVLLLPLVIFPAATGYAILRYRLLNTDFILSRLTLYAALSILTASAYALLVSGLSLILGNAIPANNPLLTGVVVFVFAILLIPIRQRMQSFVDRVFFRGQMVYQERLQAFGRELTQTVELSAILRLLRHYVQQGIFPTQLHIYIRDPLSGQFVSEPDDEGQLTTDIRFPSNSALVQALTQRRSSIFLGGSDTLPTLLQAERTRLALLAVQLFVPLPGQLRLVGWMGLGERQSGEPYANNDLRYLESLGDQAALAVERAQVVANLERRVHEMDVLTRIAQGINITLAFDDILELIYTQTNLLIPTRDLHVCLFNKTTQTLTYAFYLEDDERLPERENVFLSEGQHLEEEVIHSRRALVTDDFERECRGRGILAQDPQIFAWIGVPLNAGAETIGAISLGSRDPSLLFTEQQLNLLQAIADQAAGAIVKARLLEESERRTRQLAMLNEVGKSLTSTLDLRPLLTKILVSAAEILNCEAGSLFMVDQQTNEMIFEVTVGPVAGELIGQRLPAGTGLVGKAVLSGQPLIANDVHRSQGWSDKTDKQTGFITRDLLVVPMKVVDRVTGVIEVINKKDGSSFNLDDQDLLTTFTSQAAIAVENARLYTQTDEALSARVEELSVMQRIDRELNASLDLERAMRITLEWALRQSRAEAGLVGLIDKSQDGQAPSLRILAFQGYDDELGPPPERDSTSAGMHRLPINIPSLQQALEVGQPQVINLQRELPPTGENPDGNEPASQSTRHMLLSQGQSQVVIPIRRTGEVIGILLLESSHPDSIQQEAVTFLSRLSDHAAIAISNAQLFADLQSANIAKSEFVSLVSHELKTPMTSIRGYADLLANGVVGPVNEMQSNFINTIRSNVTRMSTLVSDLADISRIEAGRMRLEFSAVRLQEVLQEVVRSQQAQIDEKKQKLLLEVPTELASVWGDQSRITQVLMNLVNNANKYTPTEGVVTIRAQRADNQWDPKGPAEVMCVSVQDTGFGIASKDQKKIFQKFFRSEDQNIRESPGTGLGLNITRHLVEMQGGRIWFESEPGTGTTFHFTIPIAATN